MKRYTISEGERWRVVPEELEDAIAQLARFETACEQLLAEQEELSTQLEAMKREGKQKSARFRELLGRKLVNQQLLVKVEFCGIGTGAVQNP